MGDHPEGAGTKENGTRDGDGEGGERGGTVSDSVVAEGGEGSRPPSDEPGDTLPPIGLDLAGFKRIYIGRILNPKQVCPLHHLREDRGVDGTRDTHLMPCVSM